MSAQPEQLALLDEPATPKLSERQAAVLDLVQAAGHEGLSADEVGAFLHSRRKNYPHGTETRCDNCGRDGKACLARELKPKGLVTYRRARGNRPGGWVTTSQPDPDPTPPQPDHVGPGPVPHNAFPASY